MLIFGRKARKTRKNRRKALVSVLFLLLLETALLSGCRGDPIGNATKTLSGAFDAEVSVSSGEGDVLYTATVRLLGTKEDGTRDGEIRFLSPKGAEGITLTRRDTAVTLSRAGAEVVLSEKEAERALTLFGMLTGGEVLSRSAEEAGGETVLSLTLADGRTLTLSGEDGRVLSVKKGDLTVTLLWIEPVRGTDE